jgi:hypothetical protein
MPMHNLGNILQILRFNTSGKRYIGSEILRITKLCDCLSCIAFFERFHKFAFRIILPNLSEIFSPIVAVINILIKALR